jgi:hypothetical protein
VKTQEGLINYCEFMPKSRVFYNLYNRTTTTLRFMNLSIQNLDNAEENTHFVIANSPVIK